MNLKETKEKLINETLTMIEEKTLDDDLRDLHSKLVNNAYFKQSSCIRSFNMTQDIGSPWRKVTIEFIVPIE